MKRSSRAISYLAREDELRLELGSARRKQTKNLGSFKLLLDDKGGICGLIITSYTSELEEFRKNLHAVPLGGLWKDVKITDEDIRETRSELLEKLEERW